MAHYTYLPDRRGILRGALGMGGLAFGSACLGATAQQLSKGLRTAVSGRQLRFGSAIDVADIDRPEMVALYKEHCTSLTPRNDLKWTGNEQTPGRVSYAAAEKLVDFAESIGCGSYGHTLIWYRAPGWVTQMTDPKDLRKAMRDRIQRTMRHFQGRIYAWDVVNEPLEYDLPQWRNSVFQRLLGEDHIRESFELAHEADSRPQLVLNETHLEKKGAVFDQRRSMILALVEGLRAKNVPIQCIGLQAHFRPGLDQLDPKGLGDFCARLKQMGVAIRITELDGSCRFVSRLGKVDPQRAYADVFRDVVKVAGMRGDLQGVTMWGMAEKYQPAEQGAKGSCRSRIVLYDDVMAPRPALAGMADAIRSLP